MALNLWITVIGHSSWLFTQSPEQYKNGGVHDAGVRVKLGIFYEYLPQNNVDYFHLVRFRWFRDSSLIIGKVFNVSN
jgi:hypothetical protein